MNQECLLVRWIQLGIEDVDSFRFTLDHEPSGKHDEVVLAVPQEVSGPVARGGYLDADGVFHAGICSTGRLRDDTTLVGYARNEIGESVPSNPILVPSPLPEPGAALTTGVALAFFVVVARFSKRVRR